MLLIVTSDLKSFSPSLSISVSAFVVGAPNTEFRFLPWCYSYQFPSLQVLGEDLVTILDTLHVRYVIGFGEGAGANVIARFGLAHPTRTVGLILINCTGSAVSVKENFKAKVGVRLLVFHLLVQIRNNTFTYFCVSSLWIGSGSHLWVNQRWIISYFTNSDM